MSRPVGSKNKVTKDVKEMWLTAMKMAGKSLVPGDPNRAAVNYLKHVALINPAAFLSFGKAFIPRELNLEVTEELNLTITRSFVKGELQDGKRNSAPTQVIEAQVVEAKGENGEG